MNSAGCGDEPAGAEPHRGDAAIAGAAAPLPLLHTVSGGLISRLRIFPVGPFGSSSTSHTRRGYL
jgi:hypothetical protein